MLKKFMYIIVAILSMQNNKLFCYEIWTWGDNFWGQLGDSLFEDKSYPVKLERGSDWVQISVNNKTAFAIKNDGTLWAWGHSNGYIGNNMGGRIRVPVKIGEDNNWLKVSNGPRATLAIKKDGTLWAWGENQNGQLGIGTTENIKIPTQIGKENNWTEISTGEYCSFAIRSDGTLWAWGTSPLYSAQLGDSTVKYSYTPIQIGKDKDWRFVSTNFYYTIALKKNGTLWAWGYSPDGALGGQEMVIRKQPVQIGIDSDWEMASAGGSHTLALKKDGSIWGCGSNKSRQLAADQSIKESLTFIQIGNAYDWVYIYAGTNSLAIKKNGTLWGWGQNIPPIKGDNRNDIIDTPVQIGTNKGWKYISTGEFFAAGMVDPNVHVLDNSPQNSIHIFPNPAIDKINIEVINNKFSSLDCVQIFNLKGELLREYNNLKFDKRISLDLKSLQSGNYFLKLSTNGKELIEDKFTIIR